MSRATTTLNALRAENLLAGSYILTQIETLKTQLKYRTNGDTVSFDDYYLKLQKEVEALPRLKLDTVVATGTENQYIMQLVTGLEKIFDDADRVVRKVIHFRSKLQNALSQIKKQSAAFNAWYSLAAGEALEENGAKFPSNQLKDLASSEFSRLMENLDVEVDSLLEAVKVQVEQIKTWKKTQTDKFNLGKDQANASWTSGLPNFGEPSERSDQLLEKRIEEEVDEDVPAFVSKLPQLGEIHDKAPSFEEAVNDALADNRLAGLPTVERAALKAHVELAKNDPDYAVVGTRPTLETLQKENAVGDTNEIKGTFFKRGDAKSITPIVDDAAMDIDKAAPVLQPVHVSVVVPVAAQEVFANPKATKEELNAATKMIVETPDPDHAPAVLTSIFANAQEVVPEVKITPGLDLTPNPTPIKKADKIVLTFVAPDANQVVVRTESGWPEKIHCGVCHRRIRVGQTMFMRQLADHTDGYFHAVEADCTAKPAVIRGTDKQPSTLDKLDKAITGLTEMNQTLDKLVTQPPKADPGTLLEQLETGAASVPEKGTIVPSEGTIVDNPPETKPLEQMAVVTVPNVDAPATPRKRLTFLEDDQEIM